MLFTILIIFVLQAHENYRISAFEQSYRCYPVSFIDKVWIVNLENLLINFSQKNFSN